MDKIMAALVGLVAGFVLILAIGLVSIKLGSKLNERNDKTVWQTHTHRQHKEQSCE